MSRTQSSPFVDTSIKPGAAAGQTATNANDHQSLKEIGSSTSSSSADIFSNSVQLPSVKNLFSNYPPNRQQRLTPRHSSSNSSSTVTSPFPRVAMRPTATPSSQRKSNLQRRGKFSLKRNYDLSATVYSSNFPEGHQLQPDFVEAYQLEDELGSGGYGFVMTARDRYEGCEVAVKFIIKDKVPEHCWINDPAVGKLPMEVVLLSYIKHENIVGCLDVFEDPVYFYLVQELHGSPWHRSEGFALDWSSPKSAGSTSSTSLSTPALSPSTSETSLVPEPQTPPHPYLTLPVSVTEQCLPESPVEEEPGTNLKGLPAKDECQTGVCRRPSYDLFECIEQSEQKRLSEDQARYVFGQVVDAVHYLDSLGICHRDIKDENVVIDQNLKIKLIDFGSATIVDPTKPRPEYDQFFGTAAYASSEILLKKTYKAAPAEVWTLGVLLSYLLAGVSPFPTIRDAIEGRIFLSETLGLKPPEGAMELMRRCLDPNPDTRITIEEIKTHPWLESYQAPGDL